MAQFWTINDRSEILLYGPIVSESGWWDDSTAPAEFADMLASFDGADVTVRINSPGGDVFAAHAIYNMLKSYSGAVTMYIDGLCASAATIVAMAGDDIIMPPNAMMMIHNPMLGMSDYFTADQLTKLAAQLEKVKGSIIAAYMARAKVTPEELTRMMDAETWLDAAECLTLGFADHIGPDEIKGIQNDITARGMVVVNTVEFDVKQYKNFPKERVVKSKMTKLEAVILNLVNRFGLLEDVEEKQPVDTAALDKLNDGSPVAAAVVDAGKKDGLTPESAQTIIDSTKNAAQNIVADMVKDAAESGSDNIGPAPAAEDYAGSALIDSMVNAMNNRTKRR